MESRIAEAAGLETRPVALVWTNEKPEGAVEFKAGRWGCVVTLFASAAARGRCAVFSRETYGCWGGGVGLGFGNCYEDFPGGVDCFCRFLSSGNEQSEEGRAMGDRVAAAGRRSFVHDFLKGERYLRDPAATKQFLEKLPMQNIPAKYVLVKPLDQVDSREDNVRNVTFFTDPDRISALVVLANYARPTVENAAVPWAAACQVMGILAYREAEREEPRALVGLTDLSARKNVRPTLGEHVMTFTVPWDLFLEMEGHVEGSFFQRDTWRSLGH
ncbi:MAG: DUF169 domain-containing protein [Acidobacteriota bacterium]